MKKIIALVMVLAGLTLLTAMVAGDRDCSRCGGTGAQEGPRAVDLGLSVQWADKDIAPETAIPDGWRLPTLAEIRELREGCTQTVDKKTVKGAWGDTEEEWMVFTGKNGNSIAFLYPMGSRSAREFGIAGSDGCYLKVIILNPLLKTPNRDGYYTWEELGETSLGQRRYPVRLVKE